jgi:hypothetical protein
MTNTAFVVVHYYDTLGIRTRGSYPQEIRVRLSDLPSLIGEIIGAMPRNAHGTALINQIIAAARARRPRDCTNAERQRRFRQRRRARERRAHSSVEETTPV